MMFFVVIFYRCFSEPSSLTYLEVFIDILWIYIDYFGLKYMQCRIHDFSDKPVVCLVYFI